MRDAKSINVGEEYGYGYTIGQSNVYGYGPDGEPIKVELVGIEARVMDSGVLDYRLTWKVADNGGLLIEDYTCSAHFTVHWSYPQ